jgi:hypothetical protein
MSLQMSLLVMVGENQFFFVISDPAITEVNTYRFSLGYPYDGYEEVVD